MHPRIDLYLQVRDELLAGKMIRASDLAQPFDRDKLSHLATPVHRSVVKVMTGDKQIALGLIVGADGWIVTKASELSDSIACELSDGRRLKTSIHSVVWQHDLAVLKADAADLPAAELVDDVPQLGAVLATVGPEPELMAVGVAGSPMFAVPRQEGMQFPLSGSICLWN